MPKNRKIILVVLVTLELLTMHLMYKSSHNKKIVLDKVELKEDINKSAFSMYIEKTDGYKEYTKQQFPEGYSLNIKLSKCLDEYGNELENILKYDNGQFTITSNKTSYCYLYFDSIPTYITKLDQTFFHNEEYKNKIMNIYFVDYIDTHNAVSNTINDLSENQDNSIKGWVEVSKDNGDMYDLYIGSNRIIYVKDDAFGAAFTQLINLKYISFENLNTTEATYLGFMFRETNVKTINNFEKLDLRNVTDISAMFQFSYSIEYLDLSAIHNENYLTMNNTFYDSNNLRYLNVQNINFEKASMLDGTFYNLNNIEIVVGTEKDKQIVESYINGDNVTITVANPS